jgi:adenine-specific DNA-methyltransferase
MYDPAFVKSKAKRGRSLPPMRFFDQPKILVVRTRNLSLARRLVATIDESGAYNLNRLTNIIPRPGYSLDGLLGILNSSLFNWIFAGTFYDYEIKPTYLRSCPMADVNNPDLIRWVQTIRGATTRVASARSALERDSEARRLSAAEAELDNVVGDLYGLTGIERRTVDRYRGLVAHAEAARSRCDSRTRC